MNTWMDDIRLLAPSDVIILICANKIDLEESRQISSEEGMEYAKENGALYIETSAKDHDTVLEAFTILTQEVLQKVEDSKCFSVPGHSIRVRFAFFTTWVWSPAEHKNLIDIFSLYCYCRTGESKKFGWHHCHWSGGPSTACISIILLREQMRMLAHMSTKPNETEKEKVWANEPNVHGHNHLSSRTILVCHRQIVGQIWSDDTAQWIEVNEDFIKLFHFVRPFVKFFRHDFSPRRVWSMWKTKRLVEQFPLHHQQLFTRAHTKYKATNNKKKNRHHRQSAQVNFYFLDTCSLNSHHHNHHHQPTTTKNHHPHQTNNIHQRITKNERIFTINTITFCCATISTPTNQHQHHQLQHNNRSTDRCRCISNWSTTNIYGKGKNVL